MPTMISWILHGRLPVIQITTLTFMSRNVASRLAIISLCALTLCLEEVRVSRLYQAMSLQEGKIWSVPKAPGVL